MAAAVALAVGVAGLSVAAAATPDRPAEPALPEGAATATATATAGAPVDAEAEIRALLDRLAASGCRFERNGRWHTAAEARDHLRAKLSRARALGRRGDADAFIAQAASRSSLTGRPYRVACGDAAPVPAGPWLRSELATLRGRGGAGGGGPR